MTVLHDQRVAIGKGGLEAVFTPVPGMLGTVVFVRRPDDRLTDAGCQFIAEVMHDDGLGTLCLDVPDAGVSGAAPRASVARRNEAWLRGALAWLADLPGGGAHRVGLLGLDAGVAVALRVAAAQPSQVAAMVAVGGRPDRAGANLAAVQAPTLLIVADEDLQALAGHRQTLRRLVCQKRLELVPGASHPLDRPGAMDVAAHLAGAWFVAHLADHRSP